MSSVILLLLFALPVFLYVLKDLKLSPEQQEFINLYKRRSENDDLRRQICKSQDTEEQKKLAYAIFKKPYLDSGIVSASRNGATIRKPKQVKVKEGLKLNSLGEVCGVICNGFYVLKDNHGDLKVICHKCAKKAIDETYSKKNLPPHPQGELIMMNLSPKDYADCHLKAIHTGQYVMVKGKFAQSEKLEFEGKQPVCEMPCCAVK